MTRHASRQRVLAYVAEFWTLYGYAPTIRELATGLGFHSTSAVRYHLQALRAAGALEWREGKTRTIRIKEQTR